MASREEFETILGVPVTVTSGKRTPFKNALVGGVPNSAHLTDSARDIVPKGMSMADAAKRLKASGKYTKVINEGDHVHVSYDTGNKVAISDADLINALTGKSAAPAAAGPSGSLSDDALIKALTSGAGAAKPKAQAPKLPPRFRPQDAAVTSFGVPFTQDLMAGVATLEDVIRRARTGEQGLPIGENFRARSQELAQARKQFEAKHPNMGEYGWVAGLAAPAGGISTAGRQGLAALMGSGAKFGATTGAAYGLGTPAADDSLMARGEQALTGAGVGATVGAAAPLVARGAGMLGQGIGSAFRGATGLGVKPATEAENMLVRALGNDEVSALNLQDLAQSGKPLTVMDVGGSNTQRLARRLTTQQGKAGEDITKFLTGRAEDQSSRVLKDITDHLSSNTDVYGLADDLTKARSAASKPLWKQAMDNAVPATSDRLKQFEADPDVQAGMKAGLKLARREALAEGEKFVPEAYGITGFDASGEPIMSGIPKWRTWQAAKEGLDAKIESFRNEVTKQLPNTKEVNSLVSLKNSLVRELDKLNPDYKVAREAWAGPSAMKSSMGMGEGFLRADPEEITKALAGMSEAEKEFYRIGAARAIQDRANAAADSADLSKRLFGNSRIRSQIETVFGKGTAEKFGRAMTEEAAMAKTNRAVLGGSNTMNKLADFSDPSTVFMQDVAEGALLGGVKGAVLNPATSAIRRKLNSLFDMNPNTAVALGELLTKAGPDALPTLTAVLEKQAKKAGRSAKASQAGKAANALLSGFAGRAGAVGLSNPQ